MNTVLYNQLRARCAAIKQSLFDGTFQPRTIRTQPTAQFDLTSASKIDAIRAKVRAIREQDSSNTLTAPPPAGTLPDARTLSQLTAEFNLIDDPGDRTEWFQANYPAIKRAQGRESYARGQRGKTFLNVEISNRRT